MSKPKHAWMVRAGNDNVLADQVENKNAIAIGWAEMGNLSSLKGRTAFKKKYEQTYPSAVAGNVYSSAGQLYRYLDEIKQGDYILTFIKASREYVIGIAQGEYIYDPNYFAADYPHIRKVNWIKRILRDNFTLEARRSLGGSQTVFNLDWFIDEIYKLTESTTEEQTVASDLEEASTEFFNEIKAQSREFIADRISQIPPFDFQNLVAAVLRAMGYYAESSKPGPDKGQDIIAYRDRLGLEKPRIIAQVKRRNEAADNTDVMKLQALLDEGSSGLFVSTGGFTKHAVNVSQNARFRITLLDREQFIDLLLENYDKLEQDYKQLVPLERIWIPMKL